MVFYAYTVFLVVRISSRVHSVYLQKPKSVIEVKPEELIKQARTLRVKALVASHEEDFDMAIHYIKQATANLIIADRMMSQPTPFQEKLDEYGKTIEVIH